MSNCASTTTHTLQISLMDTWFPVDSSDGAMSFLRAAVTLAEQGARRATSAMPICAGIARHHQGAMQPVQPNTPF